VRVTLCLLLNPVHTIQPVVNAVVKPSLTTVLNEQPLFVQPVVKPVWQRVWQRVL